MGSLPKYAPGWFRVAPGSGCGRVPRAIGDITRVLLFCGCPFKVNQTKSVLLSMLWVTGGIGVHFLRVCFRSPTCLLFARNLLVDFWGACVFALNSKHSNQVNKLGFVQTPGGALYSCFGVDVPSNSANKTRAPFFSSNLLPMAVWEETKYHAQHVRLLQS